MFNKRKFFIIKNITNPYIILSIVRTKKEANEFIDKYLYILNQSHFESWSYYKKFDIENNFKLAWETYKNTVIKQDTLDKYKVYKVLYSDVELAATLRMFCGTQPIGCSFDTQLEHDYINSKKMLQNNLYKSFKELAEEALKEDEQTTTEDESSIVQ